MDDKSLLQVLNAITTVRLKSAEKVILFVIASHDEFRTRYPRKVLVHLTGLSGVRFEDAVSSLVERGLISATENDRGMRIALSVDNLLAAEDEQRYGLT